MIRKIADNIVSPLGFSSEENYKAVCAGKSALRLYQHHFDIPEPFTASLFEEDIVDSEFDKLHSAACFSKFEKIAILSISKALHQTNIDPTSSSVQFILSTTKGNIALLDQPNSTTFSKDRVYLGTTAQVISRYFDNPNPPIIISNACISGVCAQITAMRALQNHRCSTVIVIGADVQSRFIVSGFQSFKALSPHDCKPFDKNRCGLNLGEAAATIIYQYVESNQINASDWIAVRGAIRNDANHISGPSRTGEGSYRALQAITREENREQIAFINSHGTSTAYNDEMESIAITRAQLQSVPVNSLKGYYGHTMGAAGILESILSMYAIDNHTILATRGFEQLGVSHPLLISNEHTSTDKKAFIKLLSGFGGCNAALLFKKGDLV